MKDYRFFVLVSLAYIALSLIKPSMGLDSVKNAAYYLKEMLLIMPVIFVLTALLDLWVPKDKIMRYLGQEAGAKGLVLSFVIGSVSAGPIYAAFPMCVMLHKKGASIRNIVIILSAWAVIKVPMLLNEAKYLGPKFMALRWVLTVLAILVFSWIAARIVKDEDLPQEEEKRDKVTINKEACMGCSVCAEDYPELFEMKQGKARVKDLDPSLIDKDKLKKAMDDCPVNAIEGPDA
ncbi:MAG: permease [Clostridiaceae bacterium]|nr:permease [Clostridiaceae bacterium]